MKQKPKSANAVAARSRDKDITSWGNAASVPKKASERRAPQPLDMHLYTTAFLLSAAAWPWAQQPEQKEKIEHILSGLSAEMKRGMQSYMDAPQTAQRVQQEEIWRAGSSTLLRYPAPKSDDKIPVLLVPSLINRVDILDLDAGHSFTQFLVDAGYDVYTLDWGVPGVDERQFRIDDYISQRLAQALKILQQTTREPAHVIGYCMGGTIAAGAISILKNQTQWVRSLTMLAAPWDFHAGDDMATLRMKAYLTSAEAVLLAKNVLPVDWIQMLFASIDPLFAFNKYRSYAAMDKESDAARRFVIVEDWLNDGVDLAAPSARQALQEWYIDNQPINGVWSIGADLVDTANISVPVLVVAASGDKLVPEISARAFMQ
ncbi:MAG TPA: alpha/beta fold hydrolase, partial [Alphaproteobacteria bacterium]